MSSLEEQFADAVTEHGNRTGGLMVGDVIRVGDYTVRIAACSRDCQLTFEWASPACGVGYPNSKPEGVDESTERV